MGLPSSVCLSRQSGGRWRRAIRHGRRSRRLAQEALETRALLAVSGALVDGVLSIQSSAAKDLVSLVSSADAYTVSGTGMQATTFPKSSVVAIKIADAGQVNLASQLVLLGGSATITDPITVTGIERTTLGRSISVTESAGDVVFGGPVLLPSNKTISIENSVGNVRFESTVNGAANLILVAPNQWVSFQGEIGTTTALRGLSFPQVGVVSALGRIVIDGRNVPGSCGISLGGSLGGAVLGGEGSSVTRCTTGILIEARETRDSSNPDLQHVIHGFKIFNNTVGIRFAFAAGQTAANALFRNWSITGNRIVSNRTDGIRFMADGEGRSTTLNVTITENTVSLNKRDGIRVNGTPEDLLIQKNTLTGNGIASTDAAIRFTDGLGLPRLRVQVDGNSIGFLNPAAPLKVAIGSGILATNLPGLRITGNTLTNLTRGIKLAGNLARADKSPVLAANTFSHNSVGIRLESSTNVTIDATNAINSSRSTGLWASGDCTGSSVTGAVFQNTKVAWNSNVMITGISLHGASGISLSGVSITNGAYGIRLDESQDVSIAGASIAAAKVGIWASGNCQGVTIVTPSLSDNRTSIWLAAASGLAVYGGTASGSASGAGIELSGICSGTTVSGVSLSAHGTAIRLESAQGAAVSGITSTLGKDGLSANGLCSGTQLTGLSMTGGTGYGALVSAQGLTIENSTFDGNLRGGLWASGNCTGTVVTGSSFGDNQHPLVEDAFVWGIRLGKGEAGAQGLTLSSCTASGNEGVGLFVQGASAGTTIAGCTFANNGRDGVSLADAMGLTLAAGNSATGNAGWGLYAVGGCVGATITGSTFSGNHDGIQLLSATGVAVSGVTVNDNERFGLFVNGSATGVTVANSTFSGNNAGITLFSAQGLAIQAGNTIQGNLSGLDVSGNCAGTTVVGSAFKNNTDRGVWLDGATNITLNGLNKIQGNGNNGVYVTGTCTGSKVNGNLISANANAGLKLEDAKSFEAKNNTVINNQSFGLRATGVSTGTKVTGNTITNNKVNISVTATGGTFQKA